MPISSKAKDVDSSFYKSSANEYDDYGEDFEESADNSDNEMFVNGRKDKSDSAGKHSDLLERDVTEMTQESFSTKKRKEQSFASSFGYTPRGNVRSQPPAARDKQSTAGYGRHRKTRTVTGSSQAKGLTRMVYDKPKSDRVVVKRVLSANRNKVHALQNLIMELESEIEHLRQENRDLKRESRIQEKTIRKYDNEEAEIPFLIQKHNSEVRVLREKLKKQRSIMEKTEEEVRKKDIEIRRLRDRVKKCEDIIRDKNLNERDALQQKVLNLEERLAEKEAKVMELDKVAKLSEKARTRELREKNEKYKNALEELKRLERMQKDLHDRFKEKEKELEFQNIYSQRIPIKKRLNKTEPLSSARGNNEVNSVNSRKLSNTTSHVGGTAAGAELAKDDTKRANLANDEDSHIETMVSALRKQEEELNGILEEERNRRKLEEDRKKLIEMEEKIRNKQEEIRKVQKERQNDLKDMQRKSDTAKQWLNDEEKSREDRERRELEEMRTRKEKDLEVIKGLEEDASFKKNYMNEWTEDAGMRLMNELDDQRARKVLLSQQNDFEGRTEREQKKESLPANLKATNDGRSLSRDPANTGTGDMRQDESKQTGKAKGKPIFLESSRGQDETEPNPLRHPPLDFRLPDNRRRGSKEYQFKKTDENLHKGLPSQSELAQDVSSIKKEQSDLVFGDYSPTVGSAGKERTTRPRKGVAKKNENDDIAFVHTSTKKPNSAESFLFFDLKKPNEQKSSSKGQSPVTQPYAKSNSFEGGKTSNAGVVNNERKNDGKSSTSSQSTGKANFGAYVPTFGNQPEGPAEVLPSSDPFAEDGPRFGRRRGQQKKSILGDEVSFASTEKKLESVSKSLFTGEDTKKTKSDIAAPFKTVNSFVDDDIEEMVLT